MNIDMIRERGHESALLACPVPAVLALSPRPSGAQVASPLTARRRVSGAEVHLTAPVAAQFQGTGLPMADRLTTIQNPYVQAQFVPTYPGDTASRHPS